MNPDWHIEHPEFFAQVDTALSVFGASRNDANIRMLFHDLGRFPGAYSPLPVEHLAMVDDEVRLLLKYIPGLVYATRGAASQILFRHEKEGIDSIQKRINLIRPDVVLMDYRLNLSGEPPYGTEVIPLLRELNRKMLIVGFSSNEENRGKFMAAGADGFVKKEDPSIALPRLRDLLTQLSS